MKSFVRSASISIVLLGLTACGGSSSSSSDDDKETNSSAQISSDNRNDLAYAAFTVISNSIIQQQFSAVNPFSILEFALGLPFGVAVESPLTPFQQDLARLGNFITDTSQANLSNLPVGINESFSTDGDCGGEATFSVDGDDISATFQNYCSDNGLWSSDETLNGSVNVTVKEADSVVTSSMQFDDFSVNANNDTIVVDGSFVTAIGSGSSVITTILSVSENDKTESLNSSLSCDGDDSCTTAAVYVNAEGKEYEVEELSISTADDVYNITAKVKDPDHGSFSLEAQDVKSCSGNGKLESGHIELADDDDSLNVDFNGDCSTMQVNYNGIAVTLDQ